MIYHAMMLDKFLPHNRFRDNLRAFSQADPHLHALSQLKYQYSSLWWEQIDVHCPGIYILTGGRQIGKSTSCKLWIKSCLEQNLFSPEQILYLPCDEIYDVKELANILRSFLDPLLEAHQSFLLIIDEVTFVKAWDRTIKALADAGYFRQGICLLTGSDTLILKEAAMRFPGRRGKANKTDFHLYPLSFSEYVKLISPKKQPSLESLQALFSTYLQCGGFLRAINDWAEQGEVLQATFATYEQWIRGDFLRQGKNEATLMAVLEALFTVGVSQVSYSTLTRKIGLISKETCIDYCRLLERMDVLIHLEAFDQNRKQGFPRKDRKFHFTDPFIQQTLLHWLRRERRLNLSLLESHFVEACVASHCHHLNKTFYFKGQGEIDVIRLHENKVQAIEIKWAESIRPNDLKMLKHFDDSLILTKYSFSGVIENIQSLPVYEFLFNLS